MFPDAYAMLDLSLSECMCYVHTSRYMIAVQKHAGTCRLERAFTRPYLPPPAGTRFRDMARLRVGSHCPPNLESLCRYIPVQLFETSTKQYLSQVLPPTSVSLIVPALASSPLRHVHHVLSPPSPFSSGKLLTDGQLTQETIQ